MNSTKKYVKFLSSGYFFRRTFLLWLITYHSPWKIIAQTKERKKKNTGARCLLAEN